MAYDEGMAERIRQRVDDVEGLVERKMFGGIGWTVHGNMACGAHNDGRMMIRCGKDDFEGLCAEPGANPMIRGGKPMSGWVLIDAEVLDTEDAMDTWVGRGVAHARSMPPKKK